MGGALSSPLGSEVPGEAGREGAAVGNSLPGLLRVGSAVSLGRRSSAPCR